MIGRRSFISTLFLAVPAFRALGCVVPLTESTFYIRIGKSPQITVRTLTDGTIKADYEGLAMALAPRHGSGKWSVFATPDGETYGARIRVKRDGRPNSITIDWLEIREPRTD